MKSEFALWVADKALDIVIDVAIDWAVDAVHDWVDS